MTVRVGVIGVGGMGACHARHVALSSDAELAWVADPDESAGRTLASELDTEWLASGDSGLGSCDALVIACPDRFHHRFVAVAIEGGLPTLCEKPLTVELRDARAIVDAEVSIGRRLIQVGFMRVYDERHLQVATAVAKLGEINHIRGIHRNTNTIARPVPQLLVESIIHDIHTVRWLSGSEITSVFASTVVRDRGPRLVVLTCQLRSGAVATLEFDDAATGYEVSIEVSADRGNVVAAEPLRPQVRADGFVTGEIGDDWFTPFLDAYRVEMNDFLASAATGVACGPSAWDGYAAQAVVEAAAESDRRGAPVAVELLPKPSLYQGAVS